jgi:hypothetical protein
MRSEVLTRVMIKNTVFWNVMPCNLERVYRSLGEMCCFPLPGRRLLSGLIMETACSSETSVNFYQITLRYVIEGRNLQCCGCLYDAVSTRSVCFKDRYSKTSFIYYVFSARRYEKEHCFGGKFPGFDAFPPDNSRTEIKRKWSIDRIILTGEKGSVRRRNSTSATFSATNPTRTGSG